MTIRRPFLTPFFRHPGLGSRAALLLLISQASLAQVTAPSDGIGSPLHSMGSMSPMTSHPGRSEDPVDCGEMEIWNIASAMCEPRAMAGMPMRMLMVHGNGFLTQTVEEGSRGQNALTLPDMFMADLGQTLGTRHYVNLEFMGTLERWTYPSFGYPELLQIGEEDKNGRPFVDHQHPHSSPVMGLTLSDTISLGEEKNYLKVFFAPRGQSTDGPVAFMHRPTGMVNPDAPLGHHIGQDVGHISSTVLGAALGIGSTTLEMSTFHGTEPAPESVDLPEGTMNSYAARITQMFSRHWYAMASAAYVRAPEPDDVAQDHIWRYSASIYNDHNFAGDWRFHNAFIYGLINGYDDTGALTSLAEEFLLQKEAMSFWGRIECLQRTPTELQISQVDLSASHWVTAPTLGYTHRLAHWTDADLGLGGSVTRDILPSEYRRTYGSDPWTAKIFLQLAGMHMTGL